MLAYADAPVEGCPTGASKARPATYLMRRMANG